MPYELSVIAKEKGFNELCFGCYSTVKFYLNDPEPPFLQVWTTEDEFGRPSIEDNNGMAGFKDGSFIPAPTHQQIIDWLREKHSIEIYVYRTMKSQEGDNYGCGGEEWKTEGETRDLFNIYAPTYYEAIIAGITEAFKLIA